MCLLIFGDPGAGPCIKEFPKLRALHEAFHQKSFQDAEGFEIVSIALEKSDKNTRNIIERQGLNWKHHIVDVSRVVLLSPLAQKFGVSELPTKFLVNPKGEFMGTNLSFEEMERILSDRLE